MTILSPLPPERARELLTDVVHERLSASLGEAQPGQCLRVSMLPETVMSELCARLSTAHPEVDVVLLRGPGQKRTVDWQVSATQLIELRNTGLRPLLVFVPPGLKTAAEDSFDISTFKEEGMGDIPALLRARLRAQLPEPIQMLIDRAIDYVHDIERLITDDDVVRYYLTVLHNLASAPTGAVDARQVAGGAIYQLHLVPDFDLYLVPDRIKQRLSRNAEVLRTLVEGTLPLLGRIHALKLKPNTLQADIYAFLRRRPIGEVQSWGESIASETQWRPLAFDRWQFEGEEDGAKRLLLFVDALDLPRRRGDGANDSEDVCYLDVRRTNRLKLRWTTDPKPVAVEDLCYFRVEIVSTDPAGGAIAWESKNIPVGKGASASRSHTLKVAEFRDQFSEPDTDGLYFFRVRAYSSSGDILNEEDALACPRILRDPGNPEGKRQYDSEDVWFWVEPGGALPPVEPARNITVDSFLEAQLLARFAAIDRGEDALCDHLVPQPDRTGWATLKGKRSEATYQIVYDAQTRFTLTVSNRLRQIESDTLRQPEMLGRWRLSRTGTGDAQALVAAPRPFHAPERVPPGFREARRRLFEAIQGGAADRLTSTVDLVEFADLILSYAQAYADWLNLVQDDFDGQAIREEPDGRRRTDPLFLDLDLVEFVLPGESQVPDRVYLLAPTHPLRLLWHLQHANLARAWLEGAQSTGSAARELTRGIRRYLCRGLVPVNLPTVLRGSHNGYPEGITHFYVEQAPLTPFWGLYLREDAEDSRTLQARVQTALGISRPVAAASEIQPGALTYNVLRYLVQHPYVHTLKINVFNPGDTAQVVEAILGVERRRIYSGLPRLRYELRLFTHGGRVDEVGGALAELINPEHTVSAEADAFTAASDNPLYPKLHFSRGYQSEFLLEPGAYEAHLSILYDLFPVRVALQPGEVGRSSFLHGLIQEQVTRFAGDQADYAWQRQLVASRCRELPGDVFAMSARLAEMLSLTAELQASVAAGKLVSAVPTLQLNLGLSDKNLLYEIHAVSDWVLTVDRHLGLEYFDGELPDDRPIYLLDFRPQFSGTDADRLLLTTRSVDEIVRLIHPVLEDHDLLLGEGVEVFFLRLLRSLSGRLALKLLSAPSHVSEALGLALARLFLEQYSLLEDRIVLPLDAHGDLFATASAEDVLQESVSLRRGDLLLVSADPTSRTLRFQVVEVKFQAALGGVGAYVALQQTIEAQIANSLEVLRLHFDPHRAAMDRLDRQVKVKELISLLSFYLARSQRYGLVSDEAVASLRNFVERLDEGEADGRPYKLECTGVGLVFDLGHQGLDVHEEHPGLVFYRVGRDYVQRLLNNGLRRRALLQRQTEEKPASIEDAQRQTEVRKKVVRDTALHGDPSYQRVRTHFEITPLPGQRLGAPPAAPDQAASPVASGSEPALRPLEAEPGSPGTVGAVGEVAPRREEAAPAPIQTATEDPALASRQEPAPQPQHPAGVGTAPEPPACDVLLGEAEESSQYGVLGMAAGKRVALDLNGTNTISLFGVQGGGKSYTVGGIVEMAVQPLPGINLLPSPLASVIFHYHESQDYPPEFVSMVESNSAEAEVEALAREFGAAPARLGDVLILTSADKLSRRQAEFPSVRVEPILFSSNELSFKDWRFLMGVAGNQMYMKQINLIMRQLRERMTLETLRHEIEASELSDSQKQIASIRLNFAAQFIDDSRCLADVLQPGRLIIVDLRDEFIDKDEALGLFVVMLSIFANAGREEGHAFNKLIVFDEAHKYMDNPDLTGHIVDVIRQMRHQGVSVLIASQDPPSLPNAIIELSSLVILHRFNSPQWLKHVQRSVTALADLTAAQMAALRPGEAYVWATKATERVFSQKAVKLRFRPRVTRHGGGTKTAV